MSTWDKKKKKVLLMLLQSIYGHRRQEVEQKYWNMYCNYSHTIDNSGYVIQKSAYKFWCVFVSQVAVLRFLWALEPFLNGALWSLEFIFWMNTLIRNLTGDRCGTSQISVCDVNFCRTCRQINRIHSMYKAQHWNISAE